MRTPYVAVKIDAANPDGRPSAAEIVAAYGRAILEGRLPDGARLPPVRAIEVAHGISKNTVQAAWDELCARGLCVSRPREGVFVASRADVAGHRAEAAPTTAPLPRATAPRLRPAPPMTGWPDASMTWLSAVFIDPELLPRQKLAECFRSVLSSPLRPFYEAQGTRALRDAIARRLVRRGIDTRPDDVIVTTGSQQALDLVARAMAERTVGLETPVYSAAKLLFEQLDYRVTALPIDPFRPLDRELWDQRLRRDRPALVYLISSYQNPTGRSYDSDELAFLLDRSAALGFAILEDDWGSDMLSLSAYRPTLRALGGPDVLYVDSFTKKLLPSLRLGYLVAPEGARQSLVAAKRVATLGQAPLVEATLAEFLDRGYYDTHLERMQQALEARYLHALDTLRRLFPDGDVRFATPGGGPTIWLELPRRVDLARLRADCARRKVAIEDAAHHFVGEAHLHGFRVGYAFLPEERFAAAMEVVADAVRAQR